MPRRQPHTARITRVVARLLALAGACVPGIAGATETTLVGLFTDAAAPALRAAAPSNDPLLAGRELLNRSLASASTQMQRFGPYWLERVRFDLSFDPAFQPRYSLEMTQPLLASLYHDSAIDLQGRVVYETAGATVGHLGLHYRGRWHDQDVALGVEGGVEDRRLEEFQRYRLGAEVRLRPLEVRTNLYDDVPAHPASREIAERRLDGYDLEIGAQLPLVPWAWVWATRFWQMALNGETISTHDRIGLRLTPVAPLEIETGAETAAEVRSWFARLRWRMQLGD
jgi:Inverse autotransporter, beta-domain